jgi:hypothetical protein
VNGCQLQDGECRGRLEWHHAIKQQRLKRKFAWGAFWLPTELRWVPGSRTWPASECKRIGYEVRELADILGDERNRVWLCSHHHELVTNSRLEPPLPESVWVFAREFGLTGMLENDLARRNAA